MELYFATLIAIVGILIGGLAVDFRQRVLISRKMEKNASDLSDTLAKIQETHNGLMIRSEEIESKVSTIELRLTSTGKPADPFKAFNRG